MKRACWLLAGLAVICAVVAGIWSWSTPDRPNFPSDQSGQPQVVVHIDRDYAHRTGDLLHVDVFVRLMPGSKLDAKTLAVEGDFELSSLPQVSERVLKDGATVYRVRMAVQSFRVSKEVVLNATMVWSAGETRSHLVIPPQTLHTSNTWDGRKELQEGDDPRVPYYWYAGRHLVPLVLSSALFLVLCLLALRNLWRNRPQTQVDRALVRVVELLELVGQGACTREQHLELDGIVRRRFAIGPVPTGQIDPKLVGASLVQFLELNAVAIYGDRGIAEEDQARLRGLGNDVVLTWNLQTAQS